MISSIDNASVSSSGVLSCAVYKGGCGWKFYPLYCMVTGCTRGAVVEWTLFGNVIYFLLAVCVIRTRQ